MKTNTKVTGQSQDLNENSYNSEIVEQKELKQFPTGKPLLDVDLISRIESNFLPDYNINDFEKLLLLWIILLEDGTTDKTNSELASIFNKHYTSVSKHINKLIKVGYLTNHKSEQFRQLRVSDSTNHVLFYNYFFIETNKIYKDKVIINQESQKVNVTENKVKGTVCALKLAYMNFNPKTICDHLRSIPYDQWVSKISSNSLGFAVKHNIDTVISKYQIPLAIEIDVEYFETELTRTLNKIFKLDTMVCVASDEREKCVTEINEKNDRRLRRNTNEMWEERLIDVTEDQDLLQKKSSVGKMMKFRAVLDWVRENGIEPMGNLHLTMGADTKVYATIENKVYMKIKDDLEEYVGEYVEIRGKVIYNKYYQRNIIRNFSYHPPVILMPINPGLI